MALRHPRKKSGVNKLALASVLSVGIFGGASAHAGLMDALMNFVQNFVVKSFEQQNTDLINGQILTMSGQAAVAPKEIHEMMEASNKVYLVSQRADSTAFRVKEVYDGMRFNEPSTVNPETGEVIPAKINAGLSSDMNCQALAEKTLIQSKEEIGDAEKFNAQRRLAQLYAVSAKEKQDGRVIRHLERYCDVSEVTNGVCTLSLGKGSADTSYDYFYSKNALTQDDMDAALSYTLNVVDPVNANIEGCSTAACAGLSASNVSFQAFANVAQGAFVSQMTDRLYFEYGGSKAGKELGKNNNSSSNDNADGNATQNGTDGDGNATDTTNNSNSSSATKSGG